MERLYNLDYLRGIAAFGIMVYHYLSWTLGKFSAETFMGRVGIYGVSIFYVLSGLTLYYVYFHKLKPARADIIPFFKKRIFRIFPLLWLTTIIAVILSRKVPNFLDLFLNLSGLFGFVKWEAYFSAGVWSIGNELVFYAFFPFFVLFTKSFKPLMVLLSLLIVGMYVYFSFWVLDPSLALSSGNQWKNYINPLNQVFLFLSGFLIGHFLQKREIKAPYIITLLALGIGLFIFYPVTGDAILLVTGVNRLIFTACCILVCIAFFKMSVQLPDFIHKPLALLGEVSYSIYLLHPIVYNLTTIASTLSGRYLFPIPDGLRLAVALLSTLVLSYWVYHRYERYFMTLGRKSQPA